MELKIERFNDNGDGIGLINGKITFVPKTVPGDVVLVGDIYDYKKYYKASLIKIINNSVDRCDIKCPYYDLCGGCQIMSINYDRQLEYKKEKVINIFKKYAYMDINPLILGGNQFKYRNKIILNVYDGKLGLVKYHSHGIVNINNCLLVSDNMNNIIEIINKSVSLDNVSKVMMRESTSGDMMIKFYGDVSSDSVISNLGNLVKSIYVGDKLIFGDERIFSTLNNYSFGISPESFFQVNYEQMLKVYDKVLEYIGVGDKVLDLYCGSGSIGIYVSSKCSSVLGIEINESAILDANLNKVVNKLDNVSFICGNVCDVIDNNYICDTVIVDPPRGGLNKKTMDILLNINSKKIIYVSCNPITLVRDINYLKGKYYLDNIILVDMFPDTYHVECVCLLKLK